MFLLRVGMSERRPTCYDESNISVFSNSTADPMVYDAFIFPFIWDFQILQGYRFILMVQVGVRSKGVVLGRLVQPICNYNRFTIFASLKGNSLYFLLIWVALKYDRPSDLSRKIHFWITGTSWKSWKSKFATYLELSYLRVSFKYKLYLSIAGVLKVLIGEGQFRNPTLNWGPKGGKK